jgi:hypothetical protein
MKRVEIELVPDVYLARSTLTLLKIVGKSWRSLGKISDHVIDAKKEAAVYLGPVQMRCAGCLGASYVISSSTLHALPDWIGRGNMSSVENVDGCQL